MMAQIQRRRARWQETRPGERWADQLEHRMGSWNANIEAIAAEQDDDCRTLGSSGETERSGETYFSRVGIRTKLGLQG